MDWRRVHKIIDSPDVTGGATVVKSGIGAPNKKKYMYIMYLIYIGSLLQVVM